MAVAPSSRVKVLLVCPSLRGGGAERVILTVATSVDRQRFDPALALVQREGSYLANVPSDLAVYDLKATRVRYCAPALIRLCWHLQPDIILSAMAHLNLMVIAVRRFLPRHTRIIAGAHSTLSRALRESKRSRLWWFAYAKLYRHADRIVCPSMYVMQDLRESFGLPQHKLVTIYNPVNVRQVQKMATATPSPYHPGYRNLVAVGRLHHVKGFDLLLAAFAELAGRLPDLHLTILGEGPELPKLKGLASQLCIESKMKFAGFQENPYPYMRYADLLVSSSRREGLPMVILEALACGTNVVATACPGGTAELIEDGVTGWLVPSESVESLVRGMELGLTRTLPVSGEALSNRVETRWGIKRVLPQYESTFEAVLS